MKMKAISLHLQEAYTSHVKRLAYGTAGTKIAREIYSHASASASYFISTLIRTSSTLFSTTSVSNGIGTTVSIFIVGLGPKHFLRVITPTITQTTNCTVAYAGHCSQCS